MFERINRVKCSYGNPANFPRSARESLYACSGVTGGGGPTLVSRFSRARTTGNFIVSDKNSNERSC